jgi:hypothetical protein
LRFRYAYGSDEAARAGAARLKQGVSDAREWLDSFNQLSPAEVAETGRPRLVALARYASRQMKTVAVRADGRFVELTARASVGELDSGFADDMAGVLVEAIRYVRAEHNQLQSKLNLHVILLTMHNFHEVERRLPPAAICDKAGKPLLSWRVVMLPYFVGGDALFRQFKLDEPWDSDHNKKLIPRMPAVFAATGDLRMDYGQLASRGQTFYRVVTGLGTAFELRPDPKFRRGARGVALYEMTDGTSNTLLIAEAAEPVVWTKPEELIYDPKGPLPKLGGLFRAGTHIGMGDGSVTLLKRGADEAPLRALFTRAGGEPVKKRHRAGRR